jgi:hypothetical protein
MEFENICGGTQTLTYVATQTLGDQNKSHYSSNSQAKNNRFLLLYLCVCACVCVCVCMCAEIYFGIPDLDTLTPNSIQRKKTMQDIFLPNMKDTCL